MKWFVASDIHGSAGYCRKMLSAFEREKADKILLLGDILYHGPRNDLTYEYNPQSVAEQLNVWKDRIVCVRGNCDAEVDQVMLRFPITADYTIISEENRVILASHGHIYNPRNCPFLNKGDILLNGHTHIPEYKEYEHFVYMNPGSIGLPRDDSWHGYMLMDGDSFVWKDLDGVIKLEYRLKK